MDKGIVAKVLWIIALTKVLSEIAGTKIFVVKITVKSIVLKLWLMSDPLMSQSKDLNPNLFLGRFQCRLSSGTITRSGATPASAVTSPSRMLTRPVHGSITRHSDIKSTARSACSRQTRHPTTSLPETKSARSSFGAPLRASRQSQ